jgi:DNA-binding MarR family transcriptional regulator
MSARPHDVSSHSIPGASAQRTQEAAASVQRLSALLGRVKRDLTLRIGAALDEEGCAVDRWHALSLLADGSGHPMAELAAHSLLSPPTLTRLIDAMVADNLVYRKVDERDRRRVLVFVTRRGATLHQRLAALIERRRDDILPRDMSDEDLDRLSELLSVLTTPV